MAVALASTVSAERRRVAPLLLMVASGFAGLGYQIVWTQQCALWLGHEAAAVLAVVAAFFGGLALGALLLGPRIEASQRPVRWYAGCECVIAIWSLVLALAMSPFSTWIVHTTGVQPSPTWQWSVAFIGTFVLLLPATACMGATIPAMERVVATWSAPVHSRSAVAPSGTRSIAAMYASNTLGAVVGVLASAFWMVPQLGLTRTAGICIGLNVFCAVMSLWIFRSESAAAPGPALQLGVMPSPALGVLARLAVTGLLGIGYEVLVVRVISQVAEDTVYTFALLLAVYLIGSAIGAAAYQRWLRGTVDPGKLADRLLGVLSAACLVGAASLWGAEYIKGVGLQVFGGILRGVMGSGAASSGGAGDGGAAASGIMSGVASSTGIGGAGSVAAALAAEAFTALVAFGPPTIVMGALFSHLAAQASAAGVSFGRALGVNTLGAALAPLLFGVLAFPTLGPKSALLIVGLGYLALTSRRAWLTPYALAPAAFGLIIALAAPRLAFIDIPEGGRLVSYQEGVMAAVSVVEDADGIARLRIDNRQQEGTSATVRVDARQAWLPLLLHPSPRRALFLGLGTGVTSSSAAEDETLNVDAVELLPEVIAASSHFASALPHGVPNPRLHILNADARRYVRTTNQLYDVIVSDNFHPARSGAGSLYTVEHFKAVRGRLGEGGLFCQWLPLHQLDLKTLQTIARSFQTAFHSGWLMLASNSLETPVVGLIGRRDDSLFDAGALRARLAHASLQERITSLGIEDEFALLGGFVAGPKSFARFADGAEANTDDRPVVAYRAPLVTYAPDSLPRERLIELLKSLTIQPDELLSAPSEDDFSRRVAAYWQARDRFIVIGRDVRPLSDVTEMLAQVRAPLLSILRISPDFRPAYDPLVLMASALARTNTSDARQLLAELAEVQPERPEAAQLLRQIAATDH